MRSCSQVTVSLANWLEPGREPRLARAGAGIFFAVEVREHDFMGEERRPVKGGGAVSVRAADEFVLAVGKFDEFSLAELADQFSAIA